MLKLKPEGQARLVIGAALVDHIVWKNLIEIRYFAIDQEF